ncbi:MAG: thiamine-phosphate pyrophosphorylase [Candidatus Omnitrophota bacterium]
MDKLLRIIDVNLNRSQEGLRVCEDIVRFILEDKSLLRSFKSLRHRVRELAKRAHRTKPLILRARNIRRDYGRSTIRTESRRRDVRDIFCANAQRTKEALRVLEEISKLIDKKISQSFKKTRFRAYELEKRSSVKLEALLHN